VGEVINPVVAQLVVSVVRLSPRPLRCDEVHAALHHTDVPLQAVRQALRALEGTEVRRFGADSWMPPAKVPYVPKLNKAPGERVGPKTERPAWHLTVVWHVLANAWAATPAAIAQHARVDGLNSRSVQALVEQWRGTVFQELADGRWQVIKNAEPPVRSTTQDSSTAVHWSRGPVPLVELPRRMQGRIA
jgi:hypothetical protein